LSIKLIESEIRKFLATSEPEVLCISGQWGVGKTFAWNRYLKDAQKRATIALKRYSYVSLFGVNSLDELKYSIFENSVKSSEIGVEPSIETLRSNTTAAAERVGRKSLAFLQQIPFVKNNIGGLAPLWYLSVKETIICVDDIERRGSNLSIRDVLGLISSLKEQKKCKIALILNDEAMHESKADFQVYFEKVVDTSLAFAPSASESAEIALAADSRTDQLIAENCIRLGISNIRLIRKMQRAVRNIAPMLQEFDEGVMKQAIHSLVLLAWSVYEPTRAPALDYLRNRRGRSQVLANEKAIPANEAAWNALLDLYGFWMVDEFDLVLLKGVQNGFFDPLDVNKNGTVLDKQIRTGKLDSSYLKAWEFYHDSFENNQDEALNTLYKAFFDDARNISPTNLNGTVSLFKELGRSQQAQEMIDHYIEIRNGDSDRRLFDLERNPFSGDIKDPDVLKAFKDKASEYRDERPLASILLEIAKKNGWTPEDITVLSTSSVEQYYEAFKQTKGYELRTILNASLQFDRFLNAQPEWKEISSRAKEALKRIGSESAINARRVRQYGVDI
jgi:hypothetical protein